MYSVYAYENYGNGMFIYDDTSTSKEFRLVNPVLELSDSAAGNFKMTVPVTNVGYSFLTRMVTDIDVIKDGEVIWSGRVLDESIDFWKNRTLTCEGAFAFLNDSTQPPHDYAHCTVRDFLEGLLAVHNGTIPNSKRHRRFHVGNVTVDDPIPVEHRYTNYETTIECIRKGLLEVLGGHLFVRKGNDGFYVDYLADISIVNSQTIEFGINLLDYAASYDMSKFATVVIPLGKNLGPGSIGDLDRYRTIADVTPDHSIYIKNDDAVEAYGWIEQVIRFEDVDDPEELFEKGTLYLNLLQFDSLSLEVKALDLHYLNIDIESMKIGEMVRVISMPHGLDREYPVVKLSIPLDKPENTQFTLGNKITSEYTSANNKVNSDLLQQISTMATKDTIGGAAQHSVDEAFSTIHLSSKPIETDYADAIWNQHKLWIPNQNVGIFRPWPWNQPSEPEFTPDPNPDPYAFNFIKDDGWCVSANPQHVAGNYAYGKMWFNFIGNNNIIVIRAECFGRTMSYGGAPLMEYNYGEISNLDVDLNYNSRGGDRWGGAKYSFKNTSPGTVKDVVYTGVTSGKHTITFKYVNETSPNQGQPSIPGQPDYYAGPEYMRLRAFTGRMVYSDDAGQSKILLSGQDISTKETDVKFPGIVMFKDLADAEHSTPVVYGGNIQNSSIGMSKIDWYTMRDAPLDRLYLSNGVYLWYDTSTNHLKMNVNGTDTVVS